MTDEKKEENLEEIATNAPAPYSELPPDVDETINDGDNDEEEEDDEDEEDDDEDDEDEEDGDDSDEDDE